MTELAPTPFASVPAFYGERLYRMRELIEIIGVSRPTVYRYLIT